MTVEIRRPGQALYWLGGNIDIRVQIDLGPGAEFAGVWDSAVWGTDVWGAPEDAWTDITEYVMGVDIDYGFQRWGERSETGTCAIVVDNTLGYFTPGGTAEAPWFRPYRPGRGVRVVALPIIEELEAPEVPGGLWDLAEWDTDEWGQANPFEDVPLEVALFTGRLDASNDSFEGGGYDIAAILLCTDYMGVWSRNNPVATTATGVQSSSERVEAALDRMDWEGRSIQTGVHNMLTSDLAQSTLEECQRAADAEGGAFYASPDGLAVFKSRDWLTTDDRSVTVQGYLGYDEIPDGAQAAHVVNVETSWELARTFNDIQFAREGGTMQHVEDLASQLATGGPLTYQRTDLQNSADADVLFLAGRFLDSFKDSRVRIDAVTIVGVEDEPDEDMNRLLWWTQLGDRLAVKVGTPYGWDIERELHVVGISHSITGSDWSATFRLDDAQTIGLTYWILQDPEFGVLGETTRAQ